MKSAGVCKAGKWAVRFWSGLRGRMQGIGEQQQGSGGFARFGSEHGRLASAIGVASKTDGPGGHAAHGGLAASRNPSRSMAALFGEGRSKRTALAERQIATQHNESGGTERSRNRNQEGGSAITAGAVGEHECGSRGVRRVMDETAELSPPEMA